MKCEGEGEVCEGRERKYVIGSGKVWEEVRSFPSQG